MSESQLQASFRSVALWCRAQHIGILTPTGRKKKVPEYMIVVCDYCRSMGLTSSSTAKKERETCQTQSLTREKTRSTSRPRTKVCGQPVHIIERIGETT